MFTTANHESAKGERHFHLTAGRIVHTGPGRETHAFVGAPSDEDYKRALELHLEIERLQNRSH